MFDGKFAKFFKFFEVFCIFFGFLYLHFGQQFYKLHCLKLSEADIITAFFCAHKQNLISFGGNGQVLFKIRKSTGEVLFFCMAAIATPVSRLVIRTK